MLLNKVKTAWLSMIVLVAIALIAGCASGGFHSDKSSLEQQAFQSRKFKSSKRLVFNATRSMLISQGYDISQADISSGFILANTPITQSSSLFGKHTMKHISVTANIESLATNSTLVRLNFTAHEETSARYGIKSQQSTPIDDQSFYHQRFQQLDKELFEKTAIN
jgi:hypothetical protein